MDIIAIKKPMSAVFCAVGFLFCVRGATSAAPAVLETSPTGVVAAVSSSLAPITNLSCVVRREVQMQDGRNASVASKVVWARGNRLHVTVAEESPIHTVIDGRQVVRVTMPGNASGKAEKKVLGMVSDQRPSQAANLSSVPASAEEYLCPFDADSATDIASPEEPFARQVVFSLRPFPKNAKLSKEEAARRFVVSFDVEGHIARIDAYIDADCLRRVSVMRLEMPFSPIPGTTLYRRVESETVVDGAMLRTVSRFDSIQVNQDIPCDTFDPDTL